VTQLQADPSTVLGLYASLDNGDYLEEPVISVGHSQRLSNACVWCAFLCVCSAGQCGRTCSVQVCGVNPCVFVVRDSVGGHAQCMYVVCIPVYL